LTTIDPARRSTKKRGDNRKRLKLNKEKMPGQKENNAQGGVEG